MDIQGEAGMIFTAISALQYPYFVCASPARIACPLKNKRLNFMFSKASQNKMAKNVLIILMIAALLLTINILPATADNQASNNAILYTKVIENATDLDVEIWTNSGEQAINAAGIYLQFSTSTISAINLDLNPDFCKFVVEESINNKNGVVGVLCGLPNPGTKNKIKIAQIKFKKIKKDWTEIKFDEKSMILANDGLGTNLLNKLENKNILIK